MAYIDRQRDRPGGTVVLMSTVPDPKPIDDTVFRRDFVATMAMKGILASGEYLGPRFNPPEIADKAYQMADEMAKRRMR